MKIGPREKKSEILGGTAEGVRTRGCGRGGFAENNKNYNNIFNYNQNFNNEKL